MELLAKLSQFYEMFHKVMIRKAQKEISLIDQPLYSLKFTNSHDSHRDY